MSWWPLRSWAHPGPSLSLIKPTQGEKEREGNFLPKVSSWKKKVHTRGWSSILATRHVEVKFVWPNLLHPHPADWESDAHTGENRGTHRSLGRVRLKPRPPNSEIAP